MLLSFAFLNPVRFPDFGISFFGLFSLIALRTTTASIGLPMKVAHSGHFNILIAKNKSTLLTF